MADFLEADRFKDYYGKPFDVGGATEEERIRSGRPIRSFTDQPSLIGTENIEAATFKDTGRLIRDELIKGTEARPYESSKFEGVPKAKVGELGKIPEKPELPPADISSVSWPEFAGHLMRTKFDGAELPWSRNIAKEAELDGEIGSDEYKTSLFLKTAEVKAHTDFLDVMKGEYDRAYKEKQFAEKTERATRANSLKVLRKNRDKMFELKTKGFELFKTNGPDVSNWEKPDKDNMEALKSEEGRLERENARIVAKFPDLDPVAGMKALGVDKTQAAHKVTKSVKSTTQIDTPDALEKKYPASQYVGKIVRSTKDGQRYKSDGLKWVKIK